MTEDNRTAFEERPNVTYEDNDSEDFQTQNFFSHCHEKMLKDYGRNCSQNFSEIMSELGEENWCNMEMVIRMKLLFGHKYLLILQSNEKDWNELRECNVL
ncbi:hypothetical protein cypCar_00010955 [Cyprinus carpio]|nr:hypothetical protein cypCar_00010955 [Cyprinus carpio]